MKNFSLLVLIILVLTLSLETYGDSKSGNEINAVTAKFFDKIQASSFDEAAKLFHYPISWSKIERENESRAISHMLTVLQREFGKPSNIKPLQKEYAYYSVSAESGDPQYWQQHPNVLRKDFEVQFEKEGPGYVIIRLCNISANWEIRSVSFALAAERSDAKMRVVKIMETLFNEMKPFMNEVKKGGESI